MTIQRAEDFSTKSEEPKRIPRKKKPRPTREDRGKDAVDSSSSSRPVVYLESKRQPKPEITPPEPTPKVPSPRLLASIDRKLELFDKVIYAQAKDRRRSATKLALNIVEGPFLTVLARYKNYNLAKLMELVITNSIRADRPKKTPPEPAKATKPPKGPTKAQLEQSERDKAAPPPTTKATAIRRKGAPKTVPPRETHDTFQIVEGALDALLTGDPILKAMFCEAFLKGEIRQLLRTHEAIGQLIERLEKEELVSPSGIYTHLGKAARVLIPLYLEEQVEAERVAQEKAKERHEARIAAAIAKAKIPQEERRKLARRNKPMTPADWRALNSMT